MLEHYVVGMSLAMAARSILGESRFIDVQQSELDAHPIQTAERIYDFLGLELNDSVRSAMARWSDDNRRGARGEHKYGPDEFGLSVEDIRRGVPPLHRTLRDFADFTVMNAPARSAKVLT